MGIVASNKALYQKNGCDFDFGRQIYQNLNEIKTVQKNKKKIMNSHMSFISGESRHKLSKDQNSSILEKSNSKVHPLDVNAIHDMNVIHDMNAIHNMNAPFSPLLADKMIKRDRKLIPIYKKFRANVKYLVSTGFKLEDVEALQYL